MEITGPGGMFDVRAELARLRDRVYELEQQVSWLLGRAGRDATSSTLEEAVHEALGRSYIDAVMMYRERTGAGLAEAKQYVDRMRRSGAVGNEDESIVVVGQDLAAAEATDTPGATEAGSVDR
ncbi:hypothetical protein [Raineyella fluvialis]|uniref:Ribosomal protein L7/L12 C-terminal domain-containing protein n=1 Tax=Raineyella fluvialis TaxID=2662261 RepID=A0A5Q2FD33_9ACTN|nr:hypothetical protein [Raineyella fluvialis]QGF23687.1 hypothetical protein Rai3103_08390 [Raineyella fluvialis]